MKKVLAIATAFSLLLVSCKKENSKNPVSAPATKLLDKLTWTLSSGTQDYLDYSYDTKGRLVKVEDAEDTEEFSYTGNSIIIKVIRKADNNRTVANITGTLDAEGRIANGFGTTEYIQGVAENISFNYTYNADGSLEKYTEQSGSTQKRFEYNYANGNLVSLRAYYNNVLKFGSDYEYGITPDKSGFNSRYASGFSLNGMEGKGSKYLLNAEKRINQNNQVSAVYNYSYQLDGEGYPVKRITTGGTALEVSYTYTK